MAYVRVVAALIACAFATSVWAAEPIIIKFSHVVAQDTPKGQAAERFKELADKYTDGKVKVEVYPNSQLYKDKEELEALQLGAVQMLAPSLAKFGPLGAKEFEVYDFPCICSRTPKDCTRSRKGRSARACWTSSIPRASSASPIGTTASRIFSANKPLKKPEDFKGVKMRIQSSKVLDAQMRALGAIPQVMAFSEVYQALQTGVVDGTENPPSNMYTQKMFEVQKQRDAVRPRLSRLRGDRQQEVLGGAAGRRPRRPRKGDGGGDRLRQRDRAEGQRGRAGGDEGDRQDRLSTSRRRPSAMRCARRCTRSTSRWRIGSARI